jgi:hypothetical protein
MRIVSRQESTSGAICADFARLRLLADMNLQVKPGSRAGGTGARDPPSASGSRGAGTRTERVADTTWNRAAAIKPSRAAPM